MGNGSLPAVGRTTRAAVLDEAMRLLDGVGWHGVSLRAVARGLGVHLTSVVFQVGSKERMRELMADRLFGELSLVGAPAEPVERVVEICHRLRVVLLSRRDGAVLVSGTSVWEENTLAVSEEVVAALLGAGADETRAARAALCMEYLTLGLVQEEQSVIPGEAVSFTVDAYPSLARVSPAVADGDFAERLEFGVRALVAFGIGTGPQVRGEEDR